MFERYRVIHFVGIGGIGMSGIAELLHNLGYVVTGSDLRESETTRRLRGLGINVYIGHKEENVDDAHVLVISSAISNNNPEVLEAKRRSIPVIPRAEMLAEIARLKYGILVAGAHGKTTTTSLTSAILSHSGFDPTVVIGGRLKATGSNARLGRGDFIVAEADESDGSFLKLTPTIAVVTNIDKEHMDFFKNMSSLKKAFLEFLNKVPFYGVSIICIENRHLKSLLPFVYRRFLTYGLSEDAEIRAVNIVRGIMSTTFEVFYKGKNLGTFYIPLAGVHNVLNALASIAVGIVLNINITLIKEALRDFSGIQRRLEFKGEVGGIKVYDDYGHHPTEVVATLNALREGLMLDRRGGRLHVVFQPHRYTRTRDLLSDFAKAFMASDYLIVLDIYPAGEKPIEGINSELLVKKISEKGFKRAIYYKEREKAVQGLVKNAVNGDVILTLGAGDVWKMGEVIIKELKKIWEKKD